MMPDVHHPAGHSLYYRKTGSGDTVVLWFHGFGQNHQAFDKLIEANSEGFTHYTFDLFFHGNSVWAGDGAIDKQQWKELIQLFLDQTGIKNFSIVGFSIGCRFAVTLAEQFPDGVLKLIMLAPDGIQFRFWYWFATYPYLCRKLFHRIVTKPAFWNRLLSFLETTRLIDRKLLRFAQRQMDTQQKREQVYNSWVHFRYLKSNVAGLALMADVHKITITLIAGTRDKVVPARLVQILKNQKPVLHYHLLDANHNELIDMSGEHLFKFLRKQ
ncbi:MAG TPA: alpha/beta hydrolase [Cyclobacteriaceae bacterium]|nr:alpha/beta hydrolase [Cyclobacteriaceae bacterium]